MGKLKKQINRMVLAVIGFFLLTAAVLIPVRAAENEADCSFDVRQTISSLQGGSTENVAVSYALTREQKENPMPAGSEGDAYHFSITGNGKFHVSDFIFAQEGDYSYLLQPDGDSLSNLTYENTSYRITVYVRNTSSGLNASVVALADNGEKVPELSFEYQYSRKVLHVSFADMVAYNSEESDDNGFPHPRMKIDEYEDSPAIQGGLKLCFADGSEYEPEIINHYRDYFLIDQSMCSFVNSRGEVVTSTQDHHDLKILTFRLKDGTYAVDSAGTKYDLQQSPGVLEVRELSDGSTKNHEVSNMIVSSVSELKESDLAQAVIPEDSVFLVNNIPNSVLAGNQIMLLFDNILLPESTGETLSRLAVLVEKVKETLHEYGYSDVLEENDRRKYQGKYLDLLDAGDGNIWVTSTAGADIYWPYPAGTDQNTEFQLIHFPQLHRGYTYSDEEMDEIVSESTTEIVNIENTENGIHFFAPQNGFSPFILTWVEEGSGSDTSSGPGGSSAAGSDTDIMNGVFTEEQLESMRNKVKTGTETHPEIWIALLVTAGGAWLYLRSRHMFIEK